MPADAPEFLFAIVALTLGSGLVIGGSLVLSALFFWGRE